jgi:hypothetical protein
MTHALHRYGPVESLKNDYTVYARASRWVNREGCGPKLKKIFEIVLSEKPANFGSSKLGKNFKSGLDIEEYRAILEASYGVLSCFSNKEAVKSVLQKLKEADTGISVVVGGLIEEILKMADELDLTPHTAALSLGIHGDTSNLPGDKILEITTMCGHGMVSERLARVVIQNVRSGKMTSEEGADLLAQPCPCGIVNPDRCEAILKICKKDD